MNIFIGADHRGFERKEVIKRWLSEAGHQLHDCGNTVYDKDDDYPEYAFAVAEAVSATPNSAGIIICGSGVGVSIAANKVRGIRCAIAFSPNEVKTAREHNNINILAISADAQTEEDSKAATTVFLTTPFSSEERHARRVEQILEKELLISEGAK